MDLIEASKLADKLFGVKSFVEYNPNRSDCYIVGIDYPDYAVSISSEISWEDVIKQAKEKL